MEIGKITKLSFFLLCNTPEYIFSLFILNLFNWIIKIFGALNISNFLYASWCFWHVEQNHEFSFSNFSSVLNASKQSYIEVSLFFVIKSFLKSFGFISFCTNLTSELNKFSKYKRNGLFNFCEFLICFTFWVNLKGNVQYLHDLLQYSH